jgi:hypothetical protein
VLRLSVTPLVLLNDPSRIVVTYLPRSRVRLTITIPGRRALVRTGVADRRGRFALTMRVPAKVRLRHGRAAVGIVAQAQQGRNRASRRGGFQISDMRVWFSTSPIVKCQQTQSVVVRYHANTALRLVLIYQGKHRVTLSARTDRRGRASISLRVAYVKAHSPVSVLVQAFDGRPRVKRVEQTTAKIYLPRLCIKVSRK